MRSCLCNACEVHWWPLHVIDSGCPVCRSGLKPTNVSPSPDAQRRFKAAVAVREAVEESKAVREAAEAFFIAWDERKWKETEDFLRGLPELA